MESRLSLAQRLETKNCLFPRNLWVEKKRGLHTYFFPCLPRNRMLLSFSISNTSHRAWFDFFRGKKNRLCDFAWTFFHAVCPKCSLKQLASCNISDRSAWPCVTDRKFCFERNISAENGMKKDSVARQTINTRQAAHNKNAPIDDAAVPRNKETQSFLYAATSSSRAEWNQELLKVDQRSLVSTELIKRPSQPAVVGLNK